MTLYFLFCNVCLIFFEEGSVAQTGDEMLCISISSPVCYFYLLVKQLYIYIYIFIWVTAAFRFG